MQEAENEHIPPHPDPVREVESEHIPPHPDTGNKEGADLTALLAGMLAALGTFALLSHIFPTPTPSNDLPALLGALAGGLFGGFCSAAIAPRDGARHALWSGIVLAAIIAILTPFVMLMPTGFPSAPYFHNSNRDMIQLFTFFLILIFLAALIGAFALGAVGYLRLENWSIVSNPRSEWTYVTCSGRSICAYSPWQHPVLGRFWRTASYLSLSGACLVLIRFDIQAAFGLIAVGVSCRSIGNRCSANSADELMRHDARAPIVYLRSFADEGRKFRLGFWRALFTAAWQVLKGTLEASLARSLRTCGPFIAIGKPGEKLPSFGAARMYVDDEHWREVAEDLIWSCQLVVLQAGDTPGLRWEIQRVCETVPPDKILLFLPFEPGRAIGARHRDELYQSLKRWAGPIFPAGLPESLGEAFFIGFRSSPAWEPLVLASSRDIPRDNPNRMLFSKIINNSAFRKKREIGIASSLLIVVLATSAIFAIVSWISSW